MIKLGINGFGRIGRLAFRIAARHPDFQIVQINDPAGDAATHAHLANFDSIHGAFEKTVESDGQSMHLDGQPIAVTQNSTIDQTDWSGCDMVLEASGKFKTPELLQTYIDQGVGQVVVSAPVKGVPKIVVGVNDETRGDAAIVTAASCTTNCIAPAVKVMHETFGIRHGMITTIHDITNTQTILDAPHKDLRRARACGMSLIPTTTGSAKAITQIFPELTGRLNGHAVRIPLANASLTDCVFELEQSVTEEQVNQALKTAAEGELAGILGFEERPLVSIDYRTDPRSSIVDAPSTMVVNDTQVKLYLWYDNEWGYANRCVELLRQCAD